MAVNVYLPRNQTPMSDKFKRDGTEFSPNERMILTLLSDGEAHSREELRTALDDDLMSDRALNEAVWRLRLKLRKYGREIVAVKRATVWRYQHVMLLKGSDDS